APHRAGGFPEVLGRPAPHAETLPHPAAPARRARLYEEARRVGAEVDWLAPAEPEDGEGP
ncbi:hypothetical protein ACFWIZ_07250, partial [Streptomyces sp. NPDC127044]